MTDPNTSTVTSSSPEVSESEYLRVEADDAKTATKKAFTQAKVAVVDAVDPRELAKTHPFVAIGSAAIAGFVAALVAIPSKEQQERWRLEKIHQALHPDPVTPKPAKDTNGNGSAKPSSPFWASILKEAIGVIKPILVTAVTAGLNAKMNPQDSADGADSRTSGSNKPL